MATRTPKIVGRLLGYGKNAAKARNAKKGTFPDEVFKSKAPNQVTLGNKTLKGQYINDRGRIEPWKAEYDKYGRLKARTDYNAGNNAQGIPSTHHHTYEWGPGKTPMETSSHLPGEYMP